MISHITKLQCNSNRAIHFEKKLLYFALCHITNIFLPALSCGARGLDLVKGLLKYFFFYLFMDYFCNIRKLEGYFCNFLLQKSPLDLT